MLHEIVIAGFGGQGVMSMGQILAYAGMIENKHVSWLPSYGPEQRGGTANVSVVISDSSVGSPVFEQPSTAIVLNNPSFEKFEPKVKKGGLLIVNSSIVNLKSNRDDITIIELRANDIANQLGNSRVGGTALLGAFIQLTNAVSREAVCESFKHVLSSRNQRFIPVNVQALEEGINLVKVSEFHCMEKTE